MADSPLFTHQLQFILAVCLIPAIA